MFGSNPVSNGGRERIHQDLARDDLVLIKDSEYPYTSMCPYTIGYYTACVTGELVYNTGEVLWIVATQNLLPVWSKWI